MIGHLHNMVKTLSPVPTTAKTKQNNMGKRGRDEQNALYKILKQNKIKTRDSKQRESRQRAPNIGPSNTGPQVSLGSIYDWMNTLFRLERPG